MRNYLQTLANYAERKYWDDAQKIVDKRLEREIKNNRRLQEQEKKIQEFLEILEFAR